MKTTELRKLIREEVRKVINEVDGTSRSKKFLRAFNYQPFDDWYQMYNRFVEGDLEPRDSGYDEFIKETESIMKFLERTLQKSK
jgi:hypothetical protein